MVQKPEGEKSRKPHNGDDCRPFQQSGNEMVFLLNHQFRTFHESRFANRRVVAVFQAGKIFAAVERFIDKEHFLGQFNVCQRIALGKSSGNVEQRFGEGDFLQCGAAVECAIFVRSASSEKSFRMPIALTVSVRR